MPQYVPLDQDEFESVVVDEMGFSRLEQKAIGGNEYVYQRPVTTTTGKMYPAVIRIYSSISTRTKETRSCGRDAIRIVVLDKTTENPINGEKRHVHRTKNALGNLRKKCKDAFVEVMRTPRCPKCKSIMTLRTNKKDESRFWGCSRFSLDGEYHCRATRPL